MARGNIVTGLDIGTHSIKALVAQRKGKDWEVLSYAEIPSFGLRKGAVVSIEETSKNVQMIMSGVEKDPARAGQECPCDVRRGSGLAGRLRELY